MGMGMMIAAGALGGIGSSMTNEAALMAKDEDRVKEDASWKAREEWRMKTAATYQIAAEDRAVQRGNEKDDRDWKNEQTRAPVRAEMATTAAIGAKKAGLDFETQNADAISANTRRAANDKESDSVKDMRKAQAGYYNDRGDAVAAGNGKIPEGLKIQYNALTDEIKEKQKLIDAARAKGEWQTTKDRDGNDVSGTPEQRQLLKELSILKTQRLSLMSGAGGGAAPVIDIPGLRGGTAPAPRPASGGTLTQPGDNDYQRIYTEEYAKHQKYRADAKTPEEVERAETNLRRVREEATRAGVTLDKPAGTGMAVVPAPAAAAPASSLPRSIGDIPGAVTQTKPVSRGTDLGEENFAAKVSRLRQGVASSSTAPSDKAVKEALGAGGGSNIDQIVGEHAPTLMQAAQALKAAQEQVVMAAKSQDQGAVSRAVAGAVSAGGRLDALLKNMMPAQQKRVREALGV